MPRGVCHQIVLIMEVTCPTPWLRCPPRTVTGQFVHHGVCFGISNQNKRSVVLREHVTYRQSCKNSVFNLQPWRFHPISQSVVQQWLYRYVVLVVIIIIVDAIPILVVNHTPLTRCGCGVGVMGVGVDVGCGVWSPGNVGGHFIVILYILTHLGRVTHIRVTH